MSKKHELMSSDLMEKVCLKSPSPIGVAVGQRVRDVRFGHEQNRPHQVNDAADGQEEEGRTQRDSLFVQNLVRRKHLFRKAKKPAFFLCLFM